MADTLPKLPEPDAYGPSADYSERTEPHYRADTVRRLLAECRRQALEDAAMAVERSTAVRRTLFGMMNNCVVRPCEHAAAVRALKEQQ